MAIIIRKGKSPMESAAEEITFIPKVCKDTDEAPAAFAGSVRLKLPDFDQRMSYAELTAEARNDESPAGWIKALRLLVKKSEAHYVSVDLLHKATGRKYTSFGAMNLDPKCDAILAEVGKCLLDGFDMGNE